MIVDCNKLYKFHVNSWSLGNFPQMIYKVQHSKRIWHIYFLNGFCSIEKKLKTNSRHVQYHNYCWCKLWQKKPNYEQWIIAEINQLIVACDKSAKLNVYWQFSRVFGIFHISWNLCQWMTSKKQSIVIESGQLIVSCSESYSSKFAKLQVYLIQDWKQLRVWDQPIVVSNGFSKFEVNLLLPGMFGPVVVTVL